MALSLLESVNRRKHYMQTWDQSWSECLLWFWKPQDHVCVLCVSAQVCAISGSSASSNAVNAFGVVSPGVESKQVRANVCRCSCRPCKKRANTVITHKWQLVSSIDHHRTNSDLKGENTTGVHVKGGHFSTTARHLRCTHSLNYQCSRLSSDFGKSFCCDFVTSETILKPTDKNWMLDLN